MENASDITYIGARLGQYEVQRFITTDECGRLGYYRAVCSVCTDRVVLWINFKTAAWGLESSCIANHRRDMSKKIDALSLLMKARASGHYAERNNVAPPAEQPSPPPCICEVRTIDGKRRRMLNLGCRACVPTIAPLVSQGKRSFEP